MHPAPTHKIQLFNPAAGWRDYLVLPASSVPGGQLTPDLATAILEATVPAGWPRARVVPISTPADWALPE